MSDTKESMPAQPRTKELPAMTDRALLEDLTRTVKEGFTELRSDVQLVATDVTVVKERVRVVEDRVRIVEERQNNNSIRAQQSSEIDAKHDQAIGMLHAKVDELTTKTDAQTQLLQSIKTGASGFLKEHPSIVASVVTLITTALGAATAWFAAKGH